MCVASGWQPYDVVLSAVLDVAQEGQITGEKATVLQAAWRRRNVQGKFQTAVQEMLEINGLIEDIEKKEEELKVRQDATALQIERAMAQDLKDEPPPRMPSERDMKNPQKMQEYMLQVSHTSSRSAPARAPRPQLLRGPLRLAHWAREAAGSSPKAVCAARVAVRLGRWVNTQPDSS